MKELNWQKKIPVRIDTDVFVAGGGPAGIAAAVAAAKSGARVFLAEGLSCLGGSGTAGLVPMFMEFSNGVDFMAGGVGREIYDRMKAAKGAVLFPNCGESINAEIFKRVCDDYLIEHGVEFLLVTQLIDAATEDGKITAAILRGKSGIFAVSAKQFIDCTGDGDLSVMAGAEFEMGDEVQPGTLCTQWAGIDWSRARRDTHYQLMEQAISDGFMSVPDRHFPGGWQTGKNTMAMNGGHAQGLDGTDERSLTEAYIYQRKLITEYGEFYKKYAVGFEDVELVNTAMLIGIRESRRITGDYQLNVNDFLNRAIFDDEIGRFSYAVDMHRNATDAEEYERFEKEFRKTLRYKPGESYGIPYRALTVKGLDNLLVAGRCISVDRAVQASIRVMPGCYITGQAAGAAAALASEESLTTRQIPIKNLQRTLKQMGGFLPNFKE